MPSQISILSCDVQGIEPDALVGEGRMHFPIALQVNTRDGCLHILHAGFATKLLRMRKRPLQSYCPGKRRFTAQLLDMGETQERVDVEF